MTTTYRLKIASIALPLCLSVAVAQDRSPGTAIVQIDDSEYIIPIECNDAVRAELGIYTEPARVTRERTGRTSGVRLIVRPWKETEYLVITLDRYLAWVPRQATTGGTWRLTLDMSAASTLVEGIPQALTFDQWIAGVRSPGLEDVTIEANCGYRNPAAPAFRKLETDA